MSLDTAFTEDLTQMPERFRQAQAARHRELGRLFHETHDFLDDAFHARTAFGRVFRNAARKLHEGFKQAARERDQAHESHFDAGWHAAPASGRHEATTDKAPRRHHRSR